MNVLIVEDEHLGYERLVKLLKETEYPFALAGHTVSIRSTVSWLQENAVPDLIFMDIELADGQCFEIFKQVEVQSPIIFTTSYDEYALQAFKVNSIDYLLKPVRKEELESGLKKYMRLRQQNNRTGLQASIESLLLAFQQKQQPQNYRQRFLVKQGQRLLSIEISDIAWFHAEGKLCFLRTWENNRYLIDYTLEELGDMLDPEFFYRANRSYIVHIKSIKSISSFFKGKMILQLQPAAEDNDVLISKEKSSEFKRWLGK